jgi:glycosyltransferase involved in cell wall biosynthesis
MKNKLIVFVIDSLVGGGAEKTMLTLAHTMINEFSCRVHFILFDRIIDFEVDKEITLSFIKDPLLEKIPRMFSSIKYKLYAKRMETLLQAIEKQEGKAVNLILSNLLQSDRTLTHSLRDNIYFIIHNQQSRKHKLHLRPFLIAQRRKAVLKNRYKNKHIVGVSKGVLDDLLKSFGVRAKSSHVIYNPFEIETIKDKAREKVNDLPQEEYLLALSSFKKQKNIPRLLEAYATLSSSSPKLVIIGKGSERETEGIQSKIKDLNLEERVLLLGFRSNPYPYLAKAKLLVLSSDYEGLPTVLIESLICGTLPVSTNCPSGPSEILKGRLEPFLATLCAQDLGKKIELALKKTPQISEQDYLHFSSLNITKQYLDLT